MDRKAFNLTRVAALLLSLAWAGSAGAQLFAPPADAFQLRTSAFGFIFDADSDALDLDIKDTANLTLDATYFLNDYLAANLLATFINTEVTSGALGGSTGSVDLLPPIFTLQWHFARDQIFSPYLGVGFNYNVFVNESGFLSDTAPGGQGLNVDVDNSLGIVGEAGVNMALTRAVFATLNFRFLTFEADVDVDGEKMDELDVDAFLIGAGLGYRF